MSSSLPYDESNFDKNLKLENIIKTRDDFDIVYFGEVGLKYLEKEDKENLSLFPLKKNQSQK